MQKKADFSIIPPVSFYVSSLSTLKQMIMIVQFNPFQKVTIYLHHRKKRQDDQPRTRHLKQPEM